MPEMNLSQRLKHLRKAILAINQKSFGEQIGFDPSYVSQIESGKTIPSDRYLSLVSSKFSISEEWIKTGEGHVRRSHKIGEPNESFDHHGGWKPRSIEEIAGVPEGLGMGRAVEMLARIYHSKNRDVISAIFANLRVFCERIDQDDELSALKREMEDLRALVKNHAKAHAYYGEDRRSGIDRRQVTADSHTGVERRSGVDRRRMNLGNGAE